MNVDGRSVRSWCISALLALSAVAPSATSASAYGGIPPPSDPLTVLVLDAHTGSRIVGARLVYAGEIQAANSVEPKTQRHGHVAPPSTAMKSRSWESPDTLVAGADGGLSVMPSVSAWLLLEATGYLSRRLRWPMDFLGADTCCCIDTVSVNLTPKPRKTHGVR